MRLFNRVEHRTPESVELEFVLAGIGSRAYALAIDYIVWGAILLGFLAVSGFLAVQFSNVLGDLTGGDNVGLWTLAIQIAIFFAIYVGYFVFFETLWQGQTPGKRAAKIRIVCDDGRPVRLPQATLRALLRPFDDLLFIGAFLIAFGPQEKRLGDFAAGTLAIQDDRVEAPKDLALSDRAAAIAAAIARDGDPARLSLDAFAVVRDYLHRRDELLPEARARISRSLANRTKLAIGLQKRPENASADEFLEGLYLAYRGLDEGGRSPDGRDSPGEIFE